MDEKIKENWCATNIDYTMRPHSKCFSKDFSNVSERFCISYIAFRLFFFVDFIFFGGGGGKFYTKTNKTKVASLYMSIQESSHN